MTIQELSLYLEKLEKTTSRNAIIEILAELFQKAHASEIDKIIYLTQGRVAPTYEALEIGMADKMILKMLSFAYGVDEVKILGLFKKLGDIGKVAEKLAEEKKVKDGKFSVADVFNTLKKLTGTSGAGSVEKKISILSRLFQKLDPLSARFVARIPVGRLRLGFSDMSVLDALSWMLSKSKKHRPVIETAFNVRPDLGFIGKTIKEKGLKGLLNVKPAVFTPILMARAERLSSGEEIIKKIGKAAIEPKYDGFRLQAHYKKIKSNYSSNKVEKFPSNVKLYTRNLEEVTYMYPDVVQGILRQINAKEAIIEGEAIAFSLETGEFLPFQETTQRRRKYGIEEKAASTPLKLMVFELLYVDGKKLISEPYTLRRERLAKIIGKGDTIILAQETVTDNPHVIETSFDEYLTAGLEGILAKRLDGAYQAGARGFNWIKLKRSYATSALNDTIDCLVMGYNYGQGKRTGFGIGAFLIGVYDKEQDKYVTVSKVGTGLSDEEWRELAKRGNTLKSREKPPLYEVDKLLEPDVWVEPEIVVEIRADEITRSPFHTAGRTLKASKSGKAFDVDQPGYALRFPRLEKFRDDRKPEDVTSLKEVEEMFAKQKKKQR